MNAWDELFQGKVADQFRDTLLADLRENLLAEEGSENARRMKFGKKGDKPEPDDPHGSAHQTECHSCTCKPDEDDPLGSARQTECHSCTCLPDHCGPSKKAWAGEFSPRVQGWSMPPAPHAAL